MLNQWKQHFRRFTSILLTTAMTITAAGSYPAQTFASTVDENGTYVSEVIAYQGSLEDAQAAYPEYTFVENDLSEGGGSSKSTYLGYKTTDDVSLALRDIATLQMNGNYKIGDYQTMMEENRDGIKGMVYELQVAAKEFKENYEAGKDRAMNAYELLNKYYEEDTGLKMGDFFLADESQVSYDNYETLLMQSNSTTLNALKKILLTAVDTEEQTWVDRLAENKDFDSLLEKENKNRKANGKAALSYKAAKTYYENLFQDMITYFESGWELLRAGLNNYMEAGVSINDDAAADYMEELNEEAGEFTAEEFATYGSIYEILDKVPYEEGTMMDVFLQPFDEVDELQMYVVMDAMSEAQRELGSDLGLAEMFLSTAQQVIEPENEDSILAPSKETRDSDEEEIASMHEEMVQDVDEVIDTIEILEEMEAVDENIIEDSAISVYAGVDRDYFKGSFGMTSDAQKEQLSSDKPWYTNTAVAISSYVAGVIGVGLTVAGICKLVQSARLSNEAASLNIQISKASAAVKDALTNQADLRWNLKRMRGEVAELQEDYLRHLKLGDRASISEDELFLDKMMNSMAEVASDPGFDPDMGPLNKKVEELKLAKQNAESNAKLAKTLGYSMLVIGIALTAYSLTVNIMTLLNEEDPSYAEIPEKMVDTSKTEDPVQPYLYYNVVRDQNDKAADLNAYSSGTWLALYTTRSYDAGLPILAKDFASIRRGDTGSDTLNMGFVHEFGAQDPENLLGYSQNAQEADATYLFYNHGDAPLSGSTFGGNNSMALIILAGVAIAGCAVLFIFRKKEDQAA